MNMLFIWLIVGDNINKLEFADVSSYARSDCELNFSYTDNSTGNLMYATFDLKNLIGYAIKGVRE